jgi:pimeloyl-ACP methyl ester carboxylesterase
VNPGWVNEKVISVFEGKFCQEKGRPAMTDLENSDYASLDVPEVLLYLFHPRPEFRFSDGPAPGRDLLIPVAEGVAVGARFHSQAPGSPTLLFFHGNGEIVADYDELAPFYQRQGVNFLPVDYRGYGRSTGSPTVSAMMLDCHRIFAFVRRWLPDQGYTGPLLLMGRSLGSASVLELAASYPEAVAGLIVESGFALAGPLLQLLGVNLDAIGFEEKTGFRNVDKIKSYPGPTLIIHAEYDHIIPFSDGQALYNASPAQDKTLLKIPHANHNDILMQGFGEYMAAIKELADKVGKA